MEKDWEVKIKALEKKVEEQSRKISDLEDIEAIKRLQKAYNYYVEHMLVNAIIDCFADSNDVVLDWLEGKWLGKKGAITYFKSIESSVTGKGFTHQFMPIGGLITLSPDGKTANGRWYAFGGIYMAEDGKIKRGSLTSGTYELVYIKENGVWKILSLKWIIPYGAKISEWTTAEDLGHGFIKGTAAPPQVTSGGPPSLPAPDIKPDKNDMRYVSGYIFPFHFVHPVTGKTTDEARRNSYLKPLKFD